MGCLCKSLLCVAYSPPATKHPPPTPTLMPGQIYFSSLLTDVVGFEAGKSDSAAADFLKNGRPATFCLFILFFFKFIFSQVPTHVAAVCSAGRRAGVRVAAV